jgi:toxin ParE1/3/4
MPSFSLTNKAIADVLEIGRYTEEHWGQVQRDKYLSLIDESFSSIAQNPTQGRDCSDIKTGYRKKNVGAHVIFYRQIADDKIQIVRVLHGRMDYASHL